MKKKSCASEHDCGIAEREILDVTFNILYPRILG
jgi:hypothetical protein